MESIYQIPINISYIIIQWIEKHLNNGLLYPKQPKQGYRREEISLKQENISKYMGDKTLEEIKLLLQGHKVCLNHGSQEKLRRILHYFNLQMTPICRRVDFN